MLKIQHVKTDWLTCSFTTDLKTDEWLTVMPLEMLSHPKTLHQWVITNLCNSVEHEEPVTDNTESTSCKFDFNWKLNLLFIIFAFDFLRYPYPPNTAEICILLYFENLCICQYSFTENIQIKRLTVSGNLLISTHHHYILQSMPLP